MCYTLLKTLSYLFWDKQPYQVWEWYEIDQDTIGLPDGFSWNTPNSLMITTCVTKLLDCPTPLRHWNGWRRPQGRENRGYDVFNTLDIGQKGYDLEKLKFIRGTGYVYYYLFNWFWRYTTQTSVSFKSFVYKLYILFIEFNTHKWKSQLFRCYTFTPRSREWHKNKAIIRILFTWL